MTRRPHHWPTARRLVPRAPGDGGYTLVELLVALSLASILMAVGLSAMSTLYGTETGINTTDANLNQLLPVGTNLQQYIRSAVSPAPTPTTAGTLGQPIPPFGVYLATGAIATGKDIAASSLTFFMNAGTRHGARVAEVTAVYTNHTFTVTTTPAEVRNAQTTTCPHSDTTYTAKCVFTPATARIALQVDHVVNPNVFTYHFAGAGATRATAGKLLSPATFSSCTATACDAADIESVGVDLLVNVSPRVGRSVDQETVTYEISSASQAFNPAVG